jgi:subfamily B ATP-binding cassette protein MsbA
MTTVPPKLAGERSAPGTAKTEASDPKDAKKKIRWSEAWQEASLLVWARRGRLALGLIVMLINRLSGLVLPASSKYLIDDVLTKGRTELLWPIALVTGAATLVQAVTSYALSQVLGIAAQAAITEMRRSVHEHITRLPVRYFDKTQSGVLISRVMTDAEGIRNLVGTGLVQLTGSIVTAVLSLAVLFYLNWHLTLITLIILAAFGGVMGYAFRKLRPLFRERGKINAEVTGRLTQALGGIRVVKAYTAEKREQIVFAQGVHKLLRNVTASMTGVSMTTALSTVIVGIIGVVMILVGGNAILDKSMTIGDFVMYLFFTGMMAAPVVQMASIGTQITEAFAGLDRIREVKDTLAEDAEDASKAPLDTLRGEVAFDHVWFEYNPGVPVLKGISFVAPAGSTTALVGSSGSGKSTLVSLVMAFNRPNKGTIRIDGHDLDQLKLASYRSHLGIVLQDNFLFDGTVAENIRYGKPHASMEEVKEAARIAYCDEFVEGFADKYDTVVGERGVRLSGGQRQRVAIARAILADPRILILDEATSSLDSESEHKIQDALRMLRRGRTTFVIAHRLSTIRSADQILVLEAGEIVERGAHQELIALGGRYKQLHDRQYAWEHDRFVNPGEDLADAAGPKVVPVAPGT